jgi:hypothetical protein
MVRQDFIGEIQRVWARRGEYAVGMRDFSSSIHNQPPKFLSFMDMDLHNAGERIYILVGTVFVNKNTTAASVSPGL